ncbi:signal peptidase II [Bifidobacterium vespertilionis]|uniref:Lipoprotein signal peptidase n=1 Tax=Bifidobacterium vespertilionis TaxID=2562524 RepID=A0A5J5DYU6_9BIFI|nr:signal peptidase II [Bifidobacterium vespertilionis]KAA8816893.1 lipoprotein signal peptidase [Bifidobacterium vespertilionis]KAA8821892.1 lipoprotein signal peptidase [Bifidobacterium vespertilionis]
MSNHIEAGRLRVRVAVFACVAVAALAIDQITKALALAHLSETQSVRVIPGLLSLRLVHNPGASLGMGAGATWLISLFAMAASAVLLVMGMRTVSTRWSALLGLAFAGAVGNLIDRIAYADGFLNGKVVDFLDYGWSIGNVADIFLMAAGIGIVVLIFLGVPFSQKELDEHNARIAAGASGTSTVSGASDASDAEEPAAR